MALITDVGGFHNCTMEPHGRDYAILDFGGLKKGWIRYDGEDGEELGKERCVVVGKKNDQYGENTTSYFEKFYILVVRPTSLDGEYRRVGAGLIQSDYVVRLEFNVRIV